MDDLNLEVGPLIRFLVFDYFYAGATDRWERGRPLPLALKAQSFPNARDNVMKTNCLDFALSAGGGARAPGKAARQSPNNWFS